MLYHVGFSPCLLESIYFSLKKNMNSKLRKNTSSLLKLEVGNCPLKGVIRSRRELVFFVGITYCGKFLSGSCSGKFVLVRGATQ